MKTLLLAEDSLDLARLVCRELEEAGYRVFHAVDGAETLRLYSDRQPDLVILDWMLPKVDGLDVLRRLRRTTAVPVLMLTARSEEADRVIGLEVGADDYLTKPFGMRELVARVRALLRRAERIQEFLGEDRLGGERCVTRGPLSLDPAAHMATVNGEPLDLSRTEFSLLHLLLRNPGRTFGRAYLLDTVWGESFVVGDRSVDNAILRLRKRLGQLGDAIETIRGVGYRLKRDL